MKEIEVTEPALIIRIAKLYKEGLSEQALYEATRGVWRVGTRRDAVEYALAVAGGVVREVFVVRQWHPAGTTKYATREPSQVEVEDRWEFTGSIAPAAVRAKYVGGSVAHYFVRGATNPVFYVNV